MEFTKSKFTNEEENAKTYSKEAFDKNDNPDSFNDNRDSSLDDCIVATHDEIQKHQSNDASCEHSYS